MNPWLSLGHPGDTTLGGILGESAGLSAERRLKRFIVDEASPPLAIFLPPYRDQHREGDWYGEHAGKWLIAASRAAGRLGDAELAERVRSVANTLVGCQESSGVVSSYAPDADCRYDSPNAAKTRTWDVWVQSCLILGLIEAHRLWPEEGFLAASLRIGEALATAAGREGFRLRDLGNHAGLSATVVLEPICALGLATGAPTLRAFADQIVESLRPDLIDPVLAGKGISTVGTCKIYQLIWNLIGILRYAEWTGGSWAVPLAQAAWQDILDHHLTPGGGPWGGVAGHKEVFNPQSFFSPYGFVETCSVWVWIQLSRDLYRATGEAKYLDAVEVAALNQLLGAMDANGEDWIYFTFANGRRNATYDWACCKSSGACAWEELAPLAYTRGPNALRVGLYGESVFRGAEVTIRQEAAYPFGGNVTVQVAASQATTVELRRPAWASSFAVTLDGSPVPLPPNDGWVPVKVPAGESRIEIEMGFVPRIVPALASSDHHGQEIVRMDYFAVCYGPWSMATGLIDGYKREETVRLARLRPEDHFKLAQPPSGATGPALAWARPDGSTITYLPYYEAGGREMGRWRTTWLQVAWQ